MCFNSYFIYIEGVKLDNLPIIAGKTIDLHLLYKLVVGKGGLVEVIKRKGWKNIAKVMKVPFSTTSAAYTLRNK